MKKHFRVYPDKRIDKKTGNTFYVLVSHAIRSWGRGEKFTLWGSALIAPRKPMRFASYAEASAYEKSID